MIDEATADFASALDAMRGALTPIVVRDIPSSGIETSDIDANIQILPLRSMLFSMRHFQAFQFRTLSLKESLTHQRLSGKKEFSLLPQN
jgi:hypothetical protein